MGFLPPYAPDLNLIEHCWNTLKQRIRRERHTPRQMLATLDRKLDGMGVQKGR